MRCSHCPSQDSIYNCYVCRNPLCVDCESKQGAHSICPTCRARLQERREAEYELEARHLNCPSGFCYGLLAALAAAFAWSQAAVLIGGSFLVGAIFLGGLVGYAVMVGAGQKRGEILQQIAALLTIFGVLTAYFLIYYRTGFDSYRLLSASSALTGAFMGYPGFLNDLGFFAWLWFALGVGIAYYVPRVRRPLARE
jgi:hypothetical protein